MCKIIILSSIVDIICILLVKLVKFLLCFSYYLLPDGFLVNKGFISDVIIVGSAVVVVS